MARRVAPLTAMLKKGARVRWTEEAEQGVQECLKALTTQPVLRYPNFEQTFRITTDASAYAIAAVLSQGEKGEDLPVAYASRRLTSAEARYSALERELLAVVWAVEQYRPYVYGRRFVILTDHKPLQWVGHLKETSARVSRWKERLMPYDYEVRHTPGSQNVVADWLSRAIETYAVEEATPQTLRQFFEQWTPVDGAGSREEEGEGAREEQEDSSSAEEPLEIREIQDLVNSKGRQIHWVTQTEGLRLPRVDCRREGTKRVMEVRTTPGMPKPDIIKLLKGLFTKGKKYYLHVGNEVIWKKVQELYRNGSIGDGCQVIRCMKKVITVTDQEQKKELAASYHLGKTNHRGAREMVQAVQRRYYWEGMIKTMEEVVRNCVTCNRVKADTRPPREIQRMTPTADRPMQRVEIDVFVWKGKWVTMIDTFSKLLMVREVRDGVTRAVVETIQEWGGVYGSPENIVSDNGPEFKNRQVEEEAQCQEIVWHYNTPGHSQGRGCVERVHGTLADQLRVLEVAQTLEPREAMRRAVLGYNHSIHSTTGYSPVEVMFGGAFGRRDGRTTAPEEGEANVVRRHLKEKRERWREVRERLLAEKARRVLRHNVVTRDVTGKLSIGSIVYRRISTNRRKQTERYTGPYRIVAIMEDNLYMLETCGEPGRRRQVHISQLKIPGVQHPDAPDSTGRVPERS